MSDAGIAAAKAANPALYAAMIRIRDLAETLPEPGDIFRQQNWKQMAPQVQDALLEYNDAFASEVGQAMEAQLPDQLSTQERQLANAGVKMQPDQLGAAVRTINPASIKVGDKPLSKWFASDDGKPPLWAKSNWDTINKAVTQGIFEGKSTQAIAESLIPEDVRAGLGGFTLRGDSEGAKIYRQAQQMAKSAIQQQNINLNQQLWEQNKEALEGYGLVWEWVATLDSKICPTCGPLEGRREEDINAYGVKPLVHIGCRCQVIQVRPDDEPKVRNGQEISDKPFTYKGKTLDQMNKAEREEALSTGGLYASKVRINGKMYYRRSISTSKDGYAGWLAETTDATKHQFFGSKKRVEYFNSQLAKKRNPRDVLNEMLKGPKDDKAWVPNLKGIGTPPKTLKAKPAVKPSVKTKATVAAEAKAKANRAKTEALFKQQAAEAKPKATPKPKAKPKVSAKQEVANLKAKQNAAISAKQAAKDAEIRTLKTGDEVTFAVGGYQGKGNISSPPDLADPKMPMTIKAQKNGPEWKQGQLIPANNKKGFVSKGEPAKAQVDAKQLTAAEAASKKKFEEAAAKANAAAAKAKKEAEEKAKAAAEAKKKAEADAATAKAKEAVKTTKATTSGDAANYKLKPIGTHAKDITPNADYEWDSKKFKEYGYSSAKEMKAAMDATTRYSGDDYKWFRAAQMEQVQKRGGKLSAYERAQVANFQEEVKEQRKGWGDQVRKQAEETQGLLNRGPRYEGEVYRGVGVRNKKAFDDMLKSINEDGTLKAMESWTPSKDRADGFIESNVGFGKDDYNIAVEFHLKNNKSGVPIQSINKFKEDEVLMPAGAKYRVVGMKKVDSPGEIVPTMGRAFEEGWIVEVEEIVD